MLRSPEGMAERILARAAREPRNVYAPLRERGIWGRFLQAGRDFFAPKASDANGIMGGFGAGWARPAFAFAMVAVMMAAVFFAPDAGYSGLSKPAEQQIVSLDAGGGADGLLSVADRGLALEVLTEGDLDLFELAYAEPAYVEPNVSATDIRGDLDDLILQDMEDVFL